MEPEHNRETSVSSHRSSEISGQETVSSKLAQDRNRNASLFAAVEGHACFQNTTLLVIVLNALWIGADVEWNHSSLRIEIDGRLQGPLHPIDTVVENLFCTYFFLELAIRFLAFRVKRRCYRDAWFVFDTLLVALMVFETWVLPCIEAASSNGADGISLSIFSIFRQARLLRLTRMAAITRFFPQLQTLVRSIASAAQAVGFILIFLVLVMYVFAIVFVGQLGEPLAPEHSFGDEPTAWSMFRDLPSGMMSLFTRGVLGDNLLETLLAIKDSSLLLMWLFVLFMIISGITLLNMLIGILCQVIDDNAKEEEDSKQIAELRSTITEAFHLADASQDGVVSATEWSKIKESKPVRATLAKLGVEESQMDERLNKMQDSLFWHPPGSPTHAPTELDFQDFVDKMIELRWDTSARVLDVEVLKAAVTFEDNTLKKRLEHIEAGLTRYLKQGGPAAPLPPGSSCASTGLQARRGSGESTRSWSHGGPPDWLAEVPTELLIGALRTRE